MPQEPSPVDRLRQRLSQPRDPVGSLRSRLGARFPGEYRGIDVGGEEPVDRSNIAAPPQQGMARTMAYEKLDNLPRGPTPTALATLATQFVPGERRRERIQEAIFEREDPEVLSRYAGLFGAEAALGTAGREAGYMIAAGPLTRAAGRGVAAASKVERAAAPRLTSAIERLTTPSSRVPRLARRLASSASSAVSGAATGAVEGTAFGVQRELLEEGPEGLAHLPLYAGAGMGLGGFFSAVVGVRMSPARALAAPAEAGQMANLRRNILRQAQNGRITPEQELAFAGEALGVNPATATEADLSAALRRKAQRFHPDQGKTPDPELMQVYTEAHSILKNHIRPAPRATTETTPEPPRRAPTEPEARPEPAETQPAARPAEEFPEQLRELPRGRRITDLPDEELVARIQQAGREVPEAGEGYRERLLDAADPERHQRLSALGEERRQLRQRLADEIRGRRNAEREALLDKRTGLQNQRAYILAQERAAADPNTSFVELDVRNLKAANDLINEAAGNELIVQAAEAARQAAAEHGVGPRNVFRSGGDEFVILAPNETAQAIRDRAVEIMGERPIGDTPYTSGLRGGIGATPDAASEAVGAAKQAETGRARTTPPEGQPPVERPVKEPELAEQDVPPATQQDVSPVGPQTLPTVDAETVQEFGALRLGNLSELSDAQLSQAAERLRDISGRLAHIAIASESGEEVGMAGDFWGRVMDAQQAVKNEIDARFKASPEYDAELMERPTTTGEVRTGEPPPAEPAEAEPVAKPAGEAVDDITARRAGLPRELQTDLNVLAEDRAWMDAVTTKGARVQHRDGFTGVVVEPAADPVNGQQRDNMVLVEHEYEGRPAQHWYNATELTPEGGPAVSVGTHHGGLERLQQLHRELRAAESAGDELSEAEFNEREVEFEERVDAIQDQIDKFRLEYEAQYGSEALEELDDAFDLWWKREQGDVESVADQVEITPEETVETAVAGEFRTVELDKPLAEHSIKELAKLRDDIRTSLRVAQNRQPVSAQPGHEGIVEASKQANAELVADIQADMDLVEAEVARVAPVFAVNASGERTPILRAKKVVIPGFEQFELFMHRANEAPGTSDKGWVITEKRTGFRLGPPQRTQAQAKEILSERLARLGVEGFQKAIDERLALLENAVRAETEQERIAEAEVAEEPSEQDVGSPVVVETPEVTAEEKPSIGYGLRGELETPPDWKPGDSISRPQVMNEISRIAEAAGKAIPLRVGRIAQRSFAGVFKVQSEVIRVREANNIATAAHEIGHATEKIVFGWEKGGPWKKPRASSAMQKELARLGKDLYGNIKPAGGYKREGFAEFWRFWLEDDPTLKKKAARFLEWFEGDFFKDYPKVAEAATKAREAVRTWTSQGSQQRARMSVVDPASPKERVKATAKSARRVLSMEKLIEMAQPLYEMAREAERQTGKPLRPSEDPFTTLSALRTTHAARTKFMVESGMINLAGEVVGPALQEIRGLVAGQQQEFTIYMWARRALALWDDPEGARDPGLSRQDAVQIIEELERERTRAVRFQTAAAKVYDWADGVLDYAAEASPTFREVVEQVRARDPGDYLPLKRAFEELDDMWARYVGGAATSRSPVKRLLGSGRRIKDPFPQLIAQTEQTLRAAHARLVLDQIIDLSRIEGMGHLIEEVPVDRVPVANISIEELVDRINREIVSADPNAPLLSIKAESEDVDLLGKTLTFFAPAQRPRGADPVVPIYNQGNVRWYRVDGKLYDTLGSLDVYRLPDIKGVPLLEWGLGKPAAAFRAGTTGLRASFGLIWNPIRDLPTMMVNSAASANGPKLLWYWIRSMADAALNRSAGVDTSPWMQTFLQLGGEMAQSLGQDIPHSRLAARRLFQGKTVRTLDPRNWFEWYRDFVQFPETAPRVAELRAMAKDIGWRPGQPMSLDQSLQLLLASKQVTTDFTAAGELARAANRMVPFLNAAIQGPRANIRAGRRNKQKFALRGLQLTMATLALWWLNKDEEWFKELDPRERFLHWWFPVGDELVRLPRPFEVGLVFGALPEALVDGWYRAEPDRVREWLKVFGESSTPNLMPVIPNIIAEQLANERFHFDTPIVPMGEQQKPAEEQFNEYTSRVAITVGRMFDVSPRRVDHAIQGMFGYVAGDVLRVIGLGAPGTDRESEVADIPVFGRLFRPGGQTGSTPASIDDVYDLLAEAQKKQHSEREPETRTERQRRLMLTDAAQAISAIYYIRSESQSTQDRRSLTFEAMEIAQEVLEAVESDRTTRGRFAAYRRKAQSREERLKDTAGRGYNSGRQRRPTRRR